MYYRWVPSQETCFKVEFRDRPACAISPGQACIMYNDTEVLGGCWIAKLKTHQNDLKLYSDIYLINKMDLAKTKYTLLPSTHNVFLISVCNLK